jgi:beta-glucosidase
MKRQPLYPFGYGLSYTTFKYSHLSAPKQVVAGKPVTVAVSVTNTGARESDEVAELFIKHLSPSLPMPNVELKAFKRIHLRPGETKRVQLTVRPQDLAVVHNDTSFWAEPEPIRLWVGGGQPGQGQAVRATLTLTGNPVKIK